MPIEPVVLLDSTFPLPLHEPFTRRMSLAAGVSDKQLGALVRAGYLRHPIQGVYVASQVPDDIWLRTRMLALVVPAGCFVCDRTAAWLHVGALALAPNEHLSVPPIACFRPADEGRLRNPLTRSGERTVLPTDLMEINGILVTTPLRTALDLGRLQRNQDLALAGMDCMLALGCFQLEELLAEVPRFRGQRGVIQLRGLAPLADGGSQSFGEAALRRRWYGAGLPRPRTQIPILIDGQVIYELDMGLEGLLFAAEYDGEEWHSTDEQVAHDAGRRLWLSDQRLWRISVFRKEQVFGPRQDASFTLAADYRLARATLGNRTYFV